MLQSCEKCLEIAQPCVVLLVDLSFLCRISKTTSAGVDATVK